MIPNIFLSPTTIYLVLITAIGLAVYTVARRNKPLVQLSGPPAAGWIKGHFSKLIGASSIEFQEDIIAKYGPTLKLNGGFGDEFIFTADPSFMHHVLVKERAKFERTDGGVLVLRSVFGGGLLAQRGSEHRAHRKLLNPMPIFMGIAKQTCEGVKKDLKESKSPSKEVDVFSWATVAALELVGEAGLGYSLGSFTGERNEYNVAIKSVSLFFSKMGPFMKVLPYVYHIGTPSIRRWMLNRIPFNDVQQLRNAVKIQNEQAEEVIRTRQVLISAGDDLSTQAGRGRDIMTLLMKANEAEGSEFHVSRQEMVGHMNTFVFAGHETTSTAVARILDVLADRPHVQVKLRDEIRQYFEKNTSDTHYEGLLELPYLDGIDVSAPFAKLSGVIRYPVETPRGKLTSIPIKKGTRIFISISASNRYTKIWGERAHEFLPERWIGTKIEEVVQPGIHIPGIYSSIAGSHACIGFKFAIMEIKVMIAELVKSFKFEPSQEEHNWEALNIQFPYAKKDINDPARVPKLALRVIELQ
ncbi:unnamed protein product [Rhizoctonia solani]|uniref:Uncharacterized protein n=1 Tax=Rhizoctonia solani TaxID=456999 RepID=A0A8H2WGK1_9AGAM|nr:unnamed protein product [Rhizoctonia solani]